MILGLNYVILGRLCSTGGVCIIHALIMDYMDYKPLYGRQWEIKLFHIWKVIPPETNVP